MSPRSNVGTSGVWRALKTIFPNEKVYDNYGRHYHVESKENRQQMLAAQYFFDCNCAACKEDWPVYRVSVTWAELSKIDGKFKWNVSRQLISRSLCNSS